MNGAQLRTALALHAAACAHLNICGDGIDVQLGPSHSGGCHYELRVLGSLAGRVWSEPELSAAEVAIGRHLEGRDTFVLLLTEQRITTPTAGKERRDVTARMADVSAVATTVGLLRERDDRAAGRVEHIVTGQGPREVLAPPMTPALAALKNVHARCDNIEVVNGSKLRAPTFGAQPRATPAPTFARFRRSLPAGVPVRPSDIIEAAEDLCTCDILGSSINRIGSREPCPLPGHERATPASDELPAVLNPEGENTAVITEGEAESFVRVRLPQPLVKHSILIHLGKPSDA